MARQVIKETESKPDPETDLVRLRRFRDESGSEIDREGGFDYCNKKALLAEG